jgi:hypothetical protein
MPLVAAAPERAERAEWTVRFTHEFDEAWNGSDKWERPSEQPPEAAMLSSIEFGKDAQIQTYRMRSEWTDGEKVEEWIVAGQHVGKRLDGTGFYIVGGENMSGKQLAKDDFPELAWIEMSNYRHVASYKGKAVFVFSIPFNSRRMNMDEALLFASARQRNPRITPEEFFSPKVKEVVAYLDVATQLPVLYNDGSSIRRYAFSKPTSPLRPPAEITTFLSERDKTLRTRLTRPAGPGTP